METNMTRRIYGSLLIPILSIVVWSGCAVGPNYKRPSVDVPGMYRGTTTEAPATSGQAAATPAPPQTAASLGDEKWWDVFEDPQLQSLIRTALKNNYDVRIAATRVLEAQAQLGITRADQYPSLAVGGSDSDLHSPAIGPIPSYEVSLGQVTAAAAWNLDFWGRYRRATEAARANLLANEWAQKQVMATLVANVAAAYF
jgi:outer membrane protein, multidrug efflux system